MSSAEPDQQLDNFVRLFRRLVTHVLHDAPTQEPVVRARVASHLGEESLAEPIVAQGWRPWDHVNLQLAIDAYVAEPGVEAELLGIAAPHKRHMSLNLSDMVMGATPMPVGFGPVDYAKLPSGPSTNHVCVTFGLYLIVAPEGPLVALVRSGDEGMGGGEVLVEVMARNPDQADAFHARLRELALAHNVFRGQVLTLGGDHEMFGQHSLALHFHERVVLPRDALVMPPGTLERIERHTTGMAALREPLQAAGRHLKRGVLLHGPPGTGKTLTARYLIGQLSDHTVLLLTGQSLGLIGTAVEVGRALQPALVILEDVDLVAEERTFPGAHNAVLFELLNAMDGVAEDADLLFVLTTNRADLLEPALAARPGRIDLGIEIPLPDDDCRRRLLERYLDGIESEVEDPDQIVARTEGITASFVKELVRAATVRALESGGPPPVVRDEHFTAALDELLDEANILTARLLGGAADRPPPSTYESMGWMPGAPAALSFGVRGPRYGGHASVMFASAGDEGFHDIVGFDDSGFDDLDDE